MSKAPCCWASNELSRDKKDYIRCSTRQVQPPCDDGKGKKGKNGKDKDKSVCCSTAFQMQMAKDAANEDTDELQCGPSKKGKKNKANKENFRCFTANMICMKLYMPGRDFECPEQLRITANICRGCKPILCSNRINVNCLPQEPSARFSMLAECLEKELNEGISVSVVYMKKEIGRGCFVPPESVILRMTNTLQEVVYTANVELTCKGCTVGMCTLRLSMHMRCQSLDVSEDDETNDDACGDMMGLNSQSGASSSTDPCLGFASIEDPSGDSSCLCKSSDNAISRRKAGTESSKKLIDMAGPYSIYGLTDNNAGCLDIKASAGPGGQFSVTSHLGSGNTNRMCPPIAPPKLKQMGIKRERECPVCHEDVSWLPQIAACPHCGYKPLPEFEEKDYNEKATAKDILVEFFDSLGVDPNAADQGSVACSQTCEQHTEGKASEGFESIVQDYKALKQSIKKCKSAQTCPGVSKSSQKAKPPDLVNVFTELRNLFYGADGDENKKAKIKEICDEACKLAKATRRRGVNKSTSKGGSSCGMIKMRKRHPKRQKMYVKSRLYTPVDPLEHRRHGHAHCREDEHKVPAHMGWLWTQHPLAQRPGWRPGAIRRSIRELMSYFLKDFPVDSIPISKYMSYHNQKPCPPIDHEEKPEDLVQLPTLHIEKKNDEYLITLRPLKDADTLKRAANPYANMKPVQFRIVKNPLLKQVREMKRCLKNMGFSKCKCHKPVMECYCRSFIDKKQLVEEVQRQCIKRNMDSCEYDLVLSDTSDSEAEFDFGVTPPAGLMHPERLKATHITHTETQYNENDWAMPTMYPHPPNAQVQYGGCVVGERQGKFDWIFGKGFVHRQPKPPKMRNPPKKKAKRPFHGAPRPRQEGGFSSTTDIGPKYFIRRDPQATAPQQVDRLQRLNRASHPPTALQFQRSRDSESKRVRFDISQNEKFII
ncbi:uncharacterized protein LOC117791276 [Drosophila innubila]|uniref:uncharacterized protein LOC117791276 n=1 Tax=Drosophila innubila TaxID=198719 RepID=UPI00148CF644|nr:uncharacterized protein LOC117791276 [Drosophila innubila]